eukprot:TRINITY_DN22438_c0_g1_i1.p1 TRINITY_DN22438_c0_g1~~TRINITY_DN22438_c0_g1_i1.p1  ORF type:complete len:425 (-),score=58.28 TRINITY_DN22438_c0_g1_i1:442-1716(-)
MRNLDSHGHCLSRAPFVASLLLLGRAGGGAAALQCWVGGLTSELCCDLRHGSRGFEGCWDAVFTFESCCSDVPAQMDDVPAGEPTGVEDVSHAVASDAFEIDLNGEASGAVQKYPLAHECWDGVHFSWDICCMPEYGPGGNEDCWDGQHNNRRCCLGIPDLPVHRELVHAGDHRARCLRAAEKAASVRVVGSAAECREGGGRLFWMGTPYGPLVESVAVHWPWWRRTANISVLRSDAPLLLTRPNRLSPRGGLCVPEACVQHSVAAYLAPAAVATGYPASPRAVAHNDSHVWLPPAAAARRAYVAFDHAWAVAADGGDAFTEFVLFEHRDGIELSAYTKVLLALLALVAVAATLASQPCALQTAAARLVEPRGEAGFDLVRVLLTGVPSCGCTPSATRLGCRVLPQPPVGKITFARHRSWALPP